jgi:hypothetical protein
LLPTKQGRRTLISFSYTVTDGITHPPPMIYQGELVLTHNVPESAEFSLRLLFFSNQSNRGVRLLSQACFYLSKAKAYYLQTLLDNSLSLSGSCFVLFLT